MGINKSSLQSRINNLANKTGVHQNILLKSFFFDAFLKRLSISEHASQFIFKGGFLLSTSLGINLRSTQDIDFLLRKIDFQRQTIENLLKEVASTKIDDNVEFVLQSVNEIRDEDLYGGYNVVLLGKLENIRETISIDLATGDPITPNDVDYEYKCLFSNEIIHFKAYNYESILAEKLQTILIRGVLNSRCKDFYDVYIIQKLKCDCVNPIILKQAFENTCKYRNTFFTKEEAFKIITQIETDSQMNLWWNTYKKRNSFVGDTQFKEAINATLLILEIVF
jgi:predicted nucleotidyltransferase component of viral defense system